MNSPVSCFANDLASWSKSVSDVKRRPFTHSCYTSRHVTSCPAPAGQNISVCSESDTLLYISANSGLLISSTSDFPTTDSNKSQKIRCDLDSQPDSETVSSTISATEAFGTAQGVIKCSMLLHFLWYVNAGFFHVLVTLPMKRGTKNSCTVWGTNCLADRKL